MNFPVARLYRSLFMQESTCSLSAFRSLIATPDLPGLGPTPRAGRLPLTDLNLKIERFIADARLPAAALPCIHSAALLWHDYLDESHAIAQNIRTIDGSFLHAIMHRREPDYGNAKYWFHRTGRHPCFPQIATEATGALATNAEEELAAQLAPQGNWDPFAFVDACEEAANLLSPDQKIQTLTAIQRIEFDCLLAHLFGKSSAAG